MAAIRHAFTPGERGTCIFPVRYNVVFRPCGKMRDLHERVRLVLPYVTREGYVISKST